MIRIGIICATIVLMCGISYPNDYTDSVQKKLLDSTIKISNSLNGQTLNFGSATLVYKEKEDNGNFTYIILGCDHVFDSNIIGPYDNTTFSIYERNERGEVIKEISCSKNDEQVSSMFIYRNSAADISIVLISIKNDFFKPLNVAKVAKEENLKNLYSVSSEVFMSGCALALDPIVMSTKVIQINIKRIMGGEVPYNAHLLSRNGIVGMSGGGVYNEDGVLIGVISFTYEDKMSGFVGVDHFNQMYESVLNLVK